MSLPTFRIGELNISFSCIERSVRKNILEILMELNQDTEQWILSLSHCTMERKKQHFYCKWHISGFTIQTSMKWTGLLRRELEQMFVSSLIMTEQDDDKDNKINESSD